MNMETHRMSAHTASRIVALLLGLCAIQLCSAQSPPTWGSSSSPSPTADSSVSKDANAAADKGMYTDVTYTNAAKPGPQIIVLPV